jgi:hypothetical protein
MGARGTFRRGNEAIAEAARRVGVADFEVEFICECADLDCFARVPLDLRAYGEIRANGAPVTAPKHDISA